MYLRPLLFLISLSTAIGFSINSLAKENKFVKYQRDTIVISNVRVIDGTGIAMANGQTVVIHQGNIQSIGKHGTLTPPASAVHLDGTGKTLLPGFVMMHEHMFYPTGKANYTEMLHSFPRLYLAGGATTVRTAGTMAPYADLNLRDAISAGTITGPDIDVTAPYLNSPGLPILKVNALGGVADAKRMVNYWADEGVTSYKAYMHIHQNELAKVIDIAHQRQHKVTAHLCSITYREAAQLGIDNLEHGFFVATDFVKNKQINQCPKSKTVTQSLADLDINAKEVTELINLLVSKNVAITSTLTIYETFVPGRPKAYKDALNVLIPQVRQQYENRWQQVKQSKDTVWEKAFANAMQLESRFVAAGGTLLVGTDPTGYGGVIAGFSSKRAIELLVENGFSLEQAIQFSTLNGAQFLGRDKEIGSIEVGKRADLILIDGDPSKNIEDIRNIDTVFKQGVGYDSQKIIDSMHETVGLH